jgi:hypothetical protein
MRIVVVIALVAVSTTTIPPYTVAFSIATMRCTALTPQQHLQRHIYFSQQKTDTDIPVTIVPNESILATTDSNNNNTSISNCCVLQSMEFPYVATEVSKQLSLPLIAIDDINEVHEQQQQQRVYQHAIVIEPYSYGNRIQNYSIGIVSLNDPSIIGKNRNRSYKPRKSGKPMKMNPYVIDFMPPKNSRLGHRTYGDSGQPDLLLKAIRLPLNSIRSSSHQLSPDNNESKNNNTELTKQPPHQQRPIIIYDVTAGFGQDALLMAHSMIKNSNRSWIQNNSNIGRVHMMERNPIIAALLQDALRRLELIATCMSTETDNTNPDQETQLAQQLYQCLSMEWNDGLHVLTNTYNVTTYNKNNYGIGSNSINSTVPDIIYLDPMFPARRKSASVKKNMQILHSLLQDECTNDNRDGENASNAVLLLQQQTMTTKDDEEIRLLQMSYQVARYRVVVKRPIHAPSIPLSYMITSDDANNNNNNAVATSSIQPSYQIVGTINRWDVYNKQKQ